MNVIKVTDDALLRRFINFPHELYSDDKHYVPELYKAQKDILSNDNPFYEHSKAELFVLMIGGEVRGRIAYIENTVHNRIYGDNAAFFGFFDVVDDYRSAEQLLNKVAELAAQNSFSKIIGPTSFTTNDPCGVLVSGFEIDPIVLMPYNKQYYADFLTEYGFAKAMDLLSFGLENEAVLQFLNKPVVQRIEKTLEKQNIVIRKIEHKRINDELALFNKVYNESNNDNWGFIPLSEKEFDKMARELKILIPEELILFAENEGDVIGFVVAVPDYNYVFKKIKKGKLLPLGVFKLLWYKRKIKKARILILGVQEEFRGKGVDFLLYKNITENLNRINIFEAEACYVMEANSTMCSILMKMNGRILKRYRLYNYSIPARQM